MVKKTIICSDCKGIGIIYTEELIDYHKRIYITNSRDCKRCGCRGILVEITKITTRALKPNEFKLCRGHNE